MHESFFGLQKRPFLAVPTLDRYCPVTSQEAAFQSCARAIARAEGPVAILGGTGLGKSMLCLRIGEVFRRSFEVILLSSSQICSRRALLQSLLFELRMPYRELSEGELRLSLLDRLQPSNENPSDGLVLIVDEAQTLSIKLLEELRLITNLTRDGVPRVRLVLCGTLRLEEMLGHPQLESLNQRLACRCYLAPLNQHETLCYLTHKVELCGATIQSTFTDDSMRLIHRATDGVPRLIDQLADQALRLAADARQRPVSASVVESAWASLQQIPLPWNDAGTPIEHGEASIEYGSLVDDNENDFANDDSAVSEPVSQPFYNQAVVASNPSPISSQSFERTIASPVPSAGMGLSRVAPLATPFDQPSEPSLVSDAWDDFVSPSDQRFETGTIEDYVEDLLDVSSALPPQPASIPETVDFEPAPFDSSYDLHSPYSPATEVAIGESYAYSTTEESAMSDQTDRQPASVPNDLFGSDFEEEVVVQLEPFVQVGMPPIEPSVNPSLNFEFNSISQPYDDDSLKPYAELLDTLSTANLEAMTLDSLDSLGEIPIDQPPIRTTGRDSFEGGLSRQTRSTILSFADLQQHQDPIVNDDRDLLIIEDDVLLHGSELDLEAKVPAAVQPYKQLFSKLRG